MNQDKRVRIGIIGGTGLEEALGAEAGEHIVAETPFGPPASSLVLTQWKNVEIVILQRHGPGHLYNPSRVPYRANIFALKNAGVTHIIASGATGSLKDQIHPGELVIVDQVIDKTYSRAQTFYEDAAVHVEMAEPFCRVMRRWLLDAAARMGMGPANVHETGTYVCMEGPAFSTRAESLMHRAWGADLIGMTCMPEAKLAREAELAYALVALPTDYDCWLAQDNGLERPQLLAEIQSNLKQATSAGIELIKEALRDVSALEREPSPAHSALKLAIWSDKTRIDRRSVDRLKPLWGKYFD